LLSFFLRQIYGIFTKKSRQEKQTYGKKARENKPAAKQVKLEILTSSRKNRISSDFRFDKGGEYSAALVGKVITEGAGDFLNQGMRP